MFLSLFFFPSNFLKSTATIDDARRKKKERKRKKKEDKLVTDHWLLKLERMTNTIAPNKATLVTNIAIVPSRLNTFYYRNDPGEKRFLEGNKKEKTRGEKRASLTVRGPSYAATTTCDIEFQRSVIRVSGYLVGATYLRCSSRTTLYRELNLVYFVSLSLSLQELLL